MAAAQEFATRGASRRGRVLVGLVGVVGLGAALVAGFVTLRSRVGESLAPREPALPMELASGVRRGVVAGASGSGHPLGVAPPTAAIREPEVAGAFYPEDSRELMTTVDGYLAAAKDRHLAKLRALVVPHAGYRFSGAVAAEGFRQLRGRSFRTVFVLAPSHHAAFRGVSVGDFSAYRTPLGLVRVAPVARVLPGAEPFSWEPAAEAQEHALEVELPFLQRVLADFSLVPLLFGAADPVRVARALAPHLDAETLVVASSDLSHFRPYDEAVALDRATLDGVVALDLGRVGGEAACGRLPVLTVMALARELGWRAQLLDYRNSGDTIGSRERVVGYGAVAFVENG